MSDDVTSDTAPPAESTEGRRRARSRNASSPNPRAQQTRRKLMTAITEKFEHDPADAGAPALTPAEVCRLAGVSPSSFYAHFDGIADLAHCALRENLVAVEQQYLERAGDSRAALSPQVLRDVLSDVLAQFDTFSGLLRTAFTRDGEAAPLIGLFAQSIGTSLLRRPPGLVPGTLPLVTTFLAGGILSVYVAHPEPEARDHVLDTLVALIPEELTGSRTPETTRTASARQDPTTAEGA